MLKLLYNGFHVEINYEDGYKAEFANKEHQRILEGTPFYLYHPMKGLGWYEIENDAISAMLVFDETKKLGSTIEWINKPEVPGLTQEQIDNQTVN